MVRCFGNGQAQFAASNQRKREENLTLIHFNFKNKLRCGEIAAHLREKNIAPAKLLATDFFAAQGAPNARNCQLRLLDMILEPLSKKEALCRATGFLYEMLHENVGQELQIGPQRTLGT